jgi:hypothetical protein
MTADVEAEKQAAAQAAAQLVEDGMTVGLGTGSTVAYLLPALASRRLALRCVATSPRTDAAARSIGLRTEPFTGVDRFDIAIDGADEVAPSGWLVKGGGAAHTREKIVAAAADRFVVIVDSTKAVPAIRGPLPELPEFGIEPPSAGSGGSGRDAARCIARTAASSPITPARSATRRARAVPAATPGVGARPVPGPQLVWAVLIDAEVGRADRRRQRRRQLTAARPGGPGHAANWSASTSERAASTRPAGIERSPASS